MSRSGVHVNELRQLDADAWTALLQEAAEPEEVTVADVAVEHLPQLGLSRYLLTFDGYSDPVPFIGKLTNAAEASFYRDIAPAVRRLVPRCWLQHVGEDWSWIVLSDVPQHWPLARWAGDDIERVIALLASLHGAFWRREEELAGYDWLIHYLDRDGALVPVDGYLDAWRTWDLIPVEASVLSAHAFQSAGRLAPTLIRAAAGLEVMRELRGWPGVINERQLQVVADLLDDPLPILQPLRDLPVTLLHGNPALHHWHFTLFDDRRLLDWSQVSIGPAVCDLVAVLEEVQWWRTRPQRTYAEAVWPVTEETIVDSYLVRMSVGLTHFDARAMRHALPAARALHVLTTWLPRFADWFQPFVRSPLTWQALLEMDDHELERVGYGRLVGLSDYLADLFVRFWHDSKSL